MDPTATGDYRLTVSLEERDRIVYEPRQWAGRSAEEAVKPDAVPRIELYVGPSPVGKVLYKDLQAMAVSQIVRQEVTLIIRQSS